MIDDGINLGVNRPFWSGHWALNEVGFVGEEEGVLDSFLPGGVGVGGWLLSRVFWGGLGEILRASGRLFAISCTMRRPEREEAPISRAGGVSFYREHPQPIFDRRCPRREVKVEKGVSEGLD